MRVFCAIQGIARQFFVPANFVTTTQQRQRGGFSTFFPFALTVLREADLIGTNRSRSRPRSTLTKSSHFSPTKSSSKSPNKMPAAEEPRPVLQFAKLSEDAKAPTRGSTNAAGYDLYSAVEVVVPAKGKNIVNTDIQIAVPDGCYGRVAPRSGLAVKSFIDVGAGVIDHDYRGNVGVVMFNFSDKDFEVKKGDRIAQLICEKIFYPELEELPNLSKTARGSDGYGSTGTK